MELNHRHKAFQASALPLSYPAVVSECDYMKKFEKASFISIFHGRKTNSLIEQECPQVTFS